MCGKVTLQALLVMQHHVYAQHGRAQVILGRMYQLRALCERAAALNPAARAPSSQHQVGAESHLRMGVRKARVAGRTFDLSTGSTLSLCFLLSVFTTCLVPMQPLHPQS